jgi:hypothetical protein
MVSYQTWTSIGHDVAKSKGAVLTGSGTQRTNQELISVLADVWQDRKEELSTATRSEARAIAEEEVNVA